MGDLIIDSERFNKYANSHMFNYMHCLWDVSHINSWMGSRRYEGGYFNQETSVYCWVTRK